MDWDFYHEIILFSHMSLGFGHESMMLLNWNLEIQKLYEVDIVENMRS